MHIEQRLKEQAESTLPTPPQSNIITLQLPEHSEAQQRYLLTIEPLGIEPVNGELATFDHTDAANDEGEEEATPDSKEPRGLLDRIGEFL